MLILEMDQTECVELLQRVQHGRLACAKDNRPYLVPVTFALDRDHLYSFSLVGQKIEWMRANDRVCLQADEFGKAGEWRSVVVHGRYEELPDRIGWKMQRERAWSLLSKHADWWEPGGRKPVAEAPAPHLFYRVVIEEMTGRHCKPE